MATVLVTGATSGPGGPLVERLRAAGHDVRALSRTPGEGRVVGDLSTGTGLDAALAGATVVVHLATNRKKDLPDTERLLVASREAGVGHVIFLSIVGVDDIPYFYYRDKVANEHAIAASGIPYTILRATQFHSFPGEILGMLGGRLFLRGLKVQPIGVVDVATRLAELATGTPAGRVADIGGPEILETRDILSRLQRAGRAQQRVLSMGLPGKTFAAFKAGHHLAGLPGYGTQTFDEWLASGASK
ncbi:NAD(P)H-binding protein [Pseudolysinimonas sp.]|uniref:SDR family oxidoreductase n=1 Tax=Pseudolysinimonas sp. TaxID=2680009 RepID=UPI00286C090F|nr:NAD(P)H-binding protein [Pseudolysinimonas sp.]